MSWYDSFSRFYDQSVENVYRPMRPEMARALALKPGATVLDLACGTGPNLPHLAEAGATRIIAVDGSKGMLARAQARVDALGLAGVRTVCADARTLDAGTLADAFDGAPVRFDGVLCSLGMSVLPEWERVLAATWNLLSPGGRYVVFDVYTRRWVPATALVRWLAEADMKREPWRALEALGAEVDHRWLDGSPHVHGGTPFLTIGTRLP